MNFKEEFQNQWLLLLSGNFNAAIEMKKIATKYAEEKSSNKEMGPSDINAATTLLFLKININKSAYDDFIKLAAILDNIDESVGKVANEQKGHILKALQIKNIETDNTTTYGNLLSSLLSIQGSIIEFNVIQHSEIQEDLTLKKFNEMISELKPQINQESNTFDKNLSSQKQEIKKKASKPIEIYNNAISEFKNFQKQKKRIDNILDGIFKYVDKYKESTNGNIIYVANQVMDVLKEMITPEVKLSKIKGIVKDSSLLCTHEDSLFKQFIAKLVHFFTFGKIKYADRLQHNGLFGKTKEGMDFEEVERLSDYSKR